jgi:hypothetical protein
MWGVWQKFMQLYSFLSITKTRGREQFFKIPRAAVKNYIVHGYLKINKCRELSRASDGFKCRITVGYVNRSISDTAGTANELILNMSRTSEYVYTIIICCKEKRKYVNTRSSAVSQIEDAMQMTFSCLV